MFFRFFGFFDESFGLFRLFGLCDYNINLVTILFFPSNFFPSNIFACIFLAGSFLAFIIILLAITLFTIFGHAEELGKTSSVIFMEQFIIRLHRVNFGNSIHIERGYPFALGFETFQTDKFSSINYFRWAGTMFSPKDDFITG